MATFTDDRRILSEAYSVQILKESFSQMTLSQVDKNLDLMSESEAEYVVTVCERVYNEFFGGFKALAGVGRREAGHAGGAISGALGKAGSAIGGGIKNMAQAGADKARQVGQGVQNAASQVGNNVKDIYNTAEAEHGSQAFAQKAQKYVDALKGELAQAQQQGMITFKGNIDEIPLGKIVDELLMSAKGHKSFAGSAQRKGAFGGVGGAFKQGMQS